jgi:hypothetical protein
MIYDASLSGLLVVYWCFVPGVSGRLPKLNVMISRIRPVRGYPGTWVPG